MILLGILGGQEMILILIAVLLLFGGKKIPEFMRGLGSGLNEFKKAKDGVYDEIHKDPKVETKEEPKEEKK
jgi:sec-independent protein translocase protein TatA